MQLSLIQIQSLFEKSDLSSDEQNKFIRFLSGAHDEELSELVSLFEEDPFWIRKLYRNFEDKKRAWTEGGGESWQSIISEEISHLREMKQGAD